MFRNVYFIQCTESISLRKFLVVLNAEVYFLPGFTKVGFSFRGPGTWLSEHTPLHKLHPVFLSIVIVSSVSMGFKNGALV